MYCLTTFEYWWNKKTDHVGSIERRTNEWHDPGIQSMKQTSDHIGC